jgi:hypothetical protein
MWMDRAALIFFVLCALVTLLPILDMLMRSRDRKSAAVRRLVRRRAPGFTPGPAATWGMLFGVALVIAASPFVVWSVVAVAVGWAAVVAHRVARAERLFGRGARVSGRITAVRLERDGLEVDYAFEVMGSSHAGTLTVTDALIVVGLAEDPTLFVFHDGQRPRLHVALFAQELEHASRATAAE